VQELEERLFKHLIPNFPTAIEITKKQYDDYRTFEQFGAGSKDTESVEGVLPEVADDEPGTSFSGTRAEAIKALRKRGFDYADLKNKKKQELIDLL